jgi:hypothetical protein
MKVVNDIWRQLVGRRLLPLAVILIGALVAVPLLLASDPETPAQPAVAPVDDSAADATETIVSLASTDTTDRRVIGEKSNPFQGDKPPKSKDETDGPKAGTIDPKDLTDALTGGDDSGTTGGSGGTGGTTGGAADPGTVAPTTPTTPTDPAPARKTYDKYDLTVRFGDSAGDLQKLTLPRLQPLPKADLPVLIYLGVSKDGKSALFLLEKGVEAVGDGVCDPSPEACETLRLRIGETEFLDVVDEEGNVGAQYQLDLVKIHKATTGSAAKASSSSKRGRQLLAEHVDAEGRLPYRFDAGSGTLERKAAARSVGNVAQGGGALR